MICTLCNFPSFYRKNSIDEERKAIFSKIETAKVQTLIFGLSFYKYYAHGNVIWLTSRRSDYVTQFGLAAMTGPVQFSAYVPNRTQVMENPKTLLQSRILEKEMRKNVLGCCEDFAVSSVSQIFYTIFRKII